MGIHTRKNIELGWDIYSLSQGDFVVEVCPDAGANVMSIRFGDQEILRQPPTLPELRGTRYGVPILYPTPNRVRRGTFNFDGQEFQFPISKGENSIHGLVHSATWKVIEAREIADRRGAVEPACELQLEFPVTPGTSAYEHFPLPHLLSLVIRVTRDAVRWTYRVDNRRGTTRVPYGFGLHPWFAYLGPREETFIQVPATDWMQAIEQMPTGTLIPVEETDISLNQFRSLADFYVDDVYFGLTPEKPAVIEHRSAGKSITLSTSEDFTHGVVFTPKDWNAFCVENQTCSTDAHNFHASGITRQSHLLIVEPGDERSGWVEYRFTSLK